MPITEKDLLKLAGSDGKGLSLTAEAVVWLMQTSTDPFTLADAAAIAIPELTQQSEVVELLTCSLLDPILSGLLDCFETDSQGKLKPVSSSRDKALAFSAAFLFIYWERLVRHSDELQRWLARSGQYAGRRRERLVEALQRVRLDENYGTQEERGVLHLMYLTLGLHNQKADETDQPVSYLTFVPTTTTLEGLSCRTLFFLAQGSELHLEDPEFLASLLEVIKRYYVQATSEEARDVCFLSFASILGYKIKKGSIPDETLTPARLRNPQVWGAAMHVLHALPLLLPRLWTPSYEAHQMSVHPVLVDTIWASIDQLISPFYAEQYLDVFQSLPLALHDIPRFFWANHVSLFASLLRVTIQSATGKKDRLPLLPSDLLNVQSERWKFSSSHFIWLIESLEALHGSGDFNTESGRETVWHATADAFLFLSCMEDIGAKATDSRLQHALQWAMNAEDPEHADEPWESPSHPYFRLQCASLSLIHVLLLSAEPGPSRRGLLLSLMKSIEDFPPKLCAFVTPPSDRQPFSESMKDRIFDRDRTFVDVLQTMALPNLEAWSNDMANDSYVRQWIDIIDRWDILHNEDDTRVWRSVKVRLRKLPLEPLLTCKRLFESMEKYWLSDRVQRAAVLIVCIGWHKRYEAPEDEAEARGEEYLKYPFLCDRLQNLLLQDPPRVNIKNAAMTEWYIDDVRDSLERLLQNQHQVSAKGRLRELTRLVQEKLAEIARYKDEVKQNETVQSRTVIGWLPASANVEGEGEDGAGLNDFRENPAFRELLHEALLSGLNDDVDEVQRNGATQTGQGWMHIHDDRNIPALGRIGDPDDILGSVRVEEGKMLADTYQPMPSYRLCTADGILKLTEGLAARLKERLEVEAQREAQ
ncbi:hypothetical protein EIP91_005205 [Steccherinum ochraceum]|uniref:Uncharacterized protein n=1 Tax=Steccherinum ochraceum TaxID=92696 RepID=A0A4V2MVU9_9APHY|nr:hypothetical protein EIP91_005205 [Steccherinum ochraceum]